MHYGLIGHPLTHSFSKSYFETKFQQLGLPGYSYSNFDISSVHSLRDLVAEKQLAGFNVTIPFKTDVLECLDYTDPVAAKIGAVNCVKVVGNNQGSFSLKGYNTDYYGFAQSIKPFLEPQHERALIFGTGGSSKAVAYALEQVGVEVYFVTRGEKKHEKCFSYNELNDYIFQAFKLLVNTTPLGMYPATDTCVPISFGALGSQYLCYDLIYNPEETLFLKQSRAQGAVTINGLNMLRLQADKSWEIWNDQAL
ncbi:MAG: shikimate dehydrogenase [Bacteroidetes bacterium]|nr:shikimate dehydrogenase [Bacteroidota bacterium]